MYILGNSLTHAHITLLMWMLFHHPSLLSSLGVQKGANFLWNLFLSLLLFFCRKDASRAHMNTGLKESLLGWASEDWLMPLGLAVAEAPLSCLHQPLPASSFPSCSVLPSRSLSSTLLFLSHLPAFLCSSPCCCLLMCSESRIPPWLPSVPLGAPGRKQDYGLHLDPPYTSIASPFPLLQ